MAWLRRLSAGNLVSLASMNEVIENDVGMADKCMFGQQKNQDGEEIEPAHPIAKTWRKNDCNKVEETSSKRS